MLIVDTLDKAGNIAGTAKTKAAGRCAHLAFQPLPAGKEPMGLMHHQDQLGQEDYYPYTFFRACEFLGICGGELDVSVKTEGKFTREPDAKFKMIVEHPLYGRLTYDAGTDKVTVEKGDLAERLTYLIHHQDELAALNPGFYYPSAFYRACEVLGICGGEVDVKIRTIGKLNLPPGACFSPAS